MKNYSHKSCRENDNTRFMFNNCVFPESRVVCKTMWENMVEPDRPQMTIKYGACAMHVG